MYSFSAGDCVLYKRRHLFTIRKWYSIELCREILPSTALILPWVYAAVEQLPWVSERRLSRGWICQNEGGSAQTLSWVQTDLLSHTTDFTVIELTCIMYRGERVALMPLFVDKDNMHKKALGSVNIITLQSLSKCLPLQENEHKQ